MVGFLKLVRLPNLIIIGITFYLIRYGIVEPFFLSKKVNLPLSDLDFFLIALSTILIAAAGYAINDYFDTQMDRINKPDKQVVGKTIKRRIAMASHLVINAFALLIALLLAFKSNIYSLLILHVFSACSLLMYSFWLKKSFFYGNFLIAILSGLIPIIAGYYEFSASSIDLPLALILQDRYFFYLLTFTIFAFSTTFIREIIKDIEDYEGDKKFNCNTLPIKLGILKTKKISAMITFFVALILALLQYKEFLEQNYLLFAYLLIFVQIPLIYLIFKTLQSVKKTDFSHLSKVLKFLMLMGILSSLIIRYTH